MAANLPFDLIVNILSRLSVRDLLRYRSVAKPWCALVDDHAFIKKHLDHALKTDSNLGVVIRGCDLYWVYLDCADLAEPIDHPIQRGGGTELLGSCNGLLALCNSFEDVALWNPATKRYRKLPNSEIEFPPGVLPCVQYIIYGFGHDPIGDDYKLVRLIQFYGDDDDSFDSEVKVYSTKTDSWKRIRDCPYYLCYKRGYGVLASNALHWVVSRKPESDVTKFVVAFDLATEEYQEIPMPGFKNRKFHMNVGVLGGSLCVICNFPNDDLNAGWDSQSKRVDLWVMKEYGVKESWTKLFSIIPSDETGPFSYILPIAYTPIFGDDVIFLDQSGKRLIVYDLEGERFEDPGIYSTDHLLETVVCVESLVGLGGGKRKNRWKQGMESNKKNDEQPKKKRGKKKKKKTKNDKMDDFLSQGFKLVL